MIGIGAALGFLLALVPVVLTPGASFTLVTGHALAGRRREAAAVIVGTMLGILTHAFLAGVGLAALVMASSQAFSVVRVLGGLVMIGLGLNLLWRARRVGQPAPDVNTVQAPLWRTLLSAYGANVLNVKAAAVYLTVAPQFLSAAQAGVLSMVQLAVVHVAAQTSWLVAWTFGWSALSRHISPRAWRRRMDALGGAVLVALGLRSLAGSR